MQPTDAFQLKSAHQNFRDKQKSVFDQLNIAAESSKNLLKNTEELERPDYSSRPVHRSEMRYLRGRESIFKRPEAPIRHCLPRGRAPGFRKNPEKWTKYTLEDVKDEDMSEKSHSAAAFSFLKELESRRQAKDETMEDDGDRPVKITFNKSAMAKKELKDEGEAKSSFKSSKVVMQEYVVGQKVKKERKNREKRAGGAKQLKLGHLEDEDDDEET